LLLLKVTVILIMLAGLTLTLLPRMPGTLVIMGAAVLYLGATGAPAPPWVIAALVVLAFAAEVGGRMLRLYLTRRYSLSRVFCVNSSVGNIGGILAADALLGPVFGLVAWEFFAGKTLAPRWDTIARVLLRLAAVAVVRFACGLLMIVLVLVYIMG
jgi:uncharacterized protein YqgC (DUF456 family)